MLSAVTVGLLIVNLIQKPPVFMDWFALFRGDLINDDLGHFIYRDRHVLRVVKHNKGPRG